MTGGSSGTDYGSRANQTVVQVVDGAGLDLTDLEEAGVGGFVAFTDTDRPFMWGRPGSEAWIAAVLGVDSSQASVFGYESGAALPGGRGGAFPAPNRRVALALHNDTAPVLTNAGWRIFEAAIQWALGGIPHEGDDPGDPCLPDLDFDTDASGVALSQGTVITDQWSAWGLAVTTNDPQDHCTGSGESRH